MTTRRGVIRLSLAAGVLFAVACGGSSSSSTGTEVDVSGVFPAGTALREAYSGATLTVPASGKLTLTQPPGTLLLLERDGAPATASFSWRNATVYFVVTDRFYNGDPTNDGAYGRIKDGQSEIGTFHGGDFVGLTQKLDYLADLGVTAIWVTPPVEQVHGWVGGGSAGDFQHWAYHGYWAQDFTRIDAALGTEAELKAFVDAAHARGIRVLLDVVMNHPGYGTMRDLADYVPGVLSSGWDTWTPGPGQNWFKYNDLFINYASPDWAGWWGVDWIRAGLGGGYTGAGSDDYTSSLSGLPDFKTESTKVVSLPPFLTHKADTGAVAIAGATVRDYLVKWHTDWVRKLGIDGFRCDTAKNVELASWAALKQAGVAALADWKAQHPADKLDDAPFFMVGEAFGHGPVRDAYYDNGFDALINFSFQSVERANVGQWPLTDDAYAAIATGLGDPTFNVMSYLSSHDTFLFFHGMGEDRTKQNEAGTALLLAPGAVQVFYGDESGRRFGPTGSDTTAGTRSDMNWGSVDTTVHDHWRKVATFRKRHPAVGGGTHQALTATKAYAFSRTLGTGASQDAVVAIVTQ